MWRRHGDAIYAILVLGVFSLETGGLVLLTWTFLAQKTSISSGLTLGSALLIAVSLTALALMLVTVYALAYQARSSRRQKLREAQANEWTKRWSEVVVGGAMPPEGPVAGGAIDALLDLREVLRGEPADRAAELLRNHGVGEELIRSVQRQGGRRWTAASSALKVPDPTRFTRRLDALDALAKARLPETFPALVPLIADPDPTLRIMVARTLARCVAAMPSGEARQTCERTMVGLLSTTDLATGAVEEALLLLDDSALPVLNGLCERLDASRPKLLVVVLDAIGRLRLLDLGDRVAGYLDSEDTEVRAAALRALGLLGHVPAAAVSQVLLAATDASEFVRIQGVRSAYLLPIPTARPLLWAGLGDQSWWVRRASAWALARMGDDGAGVLFEAARNHPDRYARSMALSVLFNSKRIDRDGAREMTRAG